LYTIISVIVVSARTARKEETVATKPGCSGAAHAIRLEIALFAEGKRFSSHRTGLSLGSSDPRRANLESDPVTLLQSHFAALFGRMERNIPQRVELDHPQSFRPVRLWGQRTKPLRGGPKATPPIAAEAHLSPEPPLPLAPSRARLAP